MRCVIYCRISIEDQSAYSLADQEARARAYASAQGWQVVRVYVDDGGSGQKVTRRAFMQMRNELAVLSVRALVVYDLDRLMRNLREQLNLMHELQRLKIDLVSLSDNGVIDTSTPEGMMHFQVKGMVSEFQAKTTGRKVRDNLQFKAKHGGWVGPAPLGYRRDAGELVPSDDAALVQRIFTAYASGNHSYASIAEDLNGAGRVIGGRAFGRESVRGILHNTAYIGLCSCSGVAYPGRHQPLVARDLWDRCQAIQERRSTNAGGKVPLRTGGLLSEIAYCGRCGARLHWHTSGRQATGYYRCGRRAGWGVAMCDAPMIRAAAIEAQALDLVRHLSITDDQRERVLDVVQQHLDRRAQPAAPDRARIQRQLERLRAAYLAGDEDLDDGVYFRERDRLTKLLAAQPEPSRYGIDVGAALERLATFGAVLDGATPLQRRTIVQELFRTVWLEKPTIVAIAPSRPFADLIEAMMVCGGCPTGLSTPPPTIPPRWSAFQVPASSIPA